MKKTVDQSNQVRRRAEHPVMDHFQRLTQSDMTNAAERKLASTKFPRHESNPRHSGVIFEVHADGHRVPGRWDMKRNTFVPTTPRRRRSPRPAEETTGALPAPNRKR
jgi:hypothetical protein